MKEVNGVKLYTTKEVAELLGSSLYFVQSRIKKGFLSSVRISRNIYVSEEGLTAYLRGSIAEPKKQGREIIK